MARRLAWVLQEFQPWTLPNSVEAEDRQEAILNAVQAGNQVVIVPYRRVNEGLNLQRGIDTIVWVEMAMNLFMLDQASRRAWRLGKEEEVRIYFLVYAGTGGHHKLRKLGGQSGAAAAFAGEPAKGALIEHAGADQTTLARLSASLEVEEDEDTFDVAAQLDVDDSEVLKAAFARRSAEEREALKRGRQWFGIRDTLPERLAAICAQGVSWVWAAVPAVRAYVLVDGALKDAKKVALEAARAGAETDASTVVEAALAQQQTVVLVPSEPTVVGPAPVMFPQPLPPTQVPVSESEPVVPMASPILHADGMVPAPAKRSALRLVFGSEEHIQLLRAQRRRRATPLRTRKRKVLSEVQDIPAFTPAGEPQDARPVMVTLSLWSQDWTASAGSVGEAGSEAAAIPLYQHQLWADERV